MTRWLVSGIGDIAVKRVIPAILAEPRSQLHSLVTRDPAKAQPYAVPAFADFEAAIRQLDVDAVYVATPVALHAPQAMAALRAGKHVLCEKPMAMNYAEAVAMGHTAERAGRVLGVAYYRRMYPKLHRARQLIEQGAIGRPVLAELTCHSWFQAEDGRRAWLLDPALSGGGPLFDIGSHRIDVLNYLFGKPARACGQRSNVVHASRVEDSATVMVEYAGGVRGIVDVRWHSRVARDEFRIVGTAGEIELSPFNGPELIHPGGVESWPPHANLHFPCIANFVDALEGKAELAAPASESAWTDWVTEQVIRSEGGLPRS